MFAFVTTGMTLETAMLMICSAVLLVLVFVLTSVSRSVRKAVETAIAKERKELDARQEELHHAQGALGERVGAAETGLAELRSSVEKAAESIAEAVAAVKSLEASVDARLTTVKEELEARLKAEEEEMVARLKALEDAQTGATTERSRTSDRVEELDGLLSVVRDELKTQAERVQGLRDYLQNTFQRDLKGAMKSFDETVCSVLGEMKDELLVGVRRIEQLESAVVNRQDAQRRITERGASEVRQLMNAESAPATASPEASAVPDEPKPDPGAESDAAAEEDGMDADTGCEPDAEAANDTDADSGGGVKFTGAPKKSPAAKSEDGEGGTDAAPAPTESADPSEAETRIGGGAAADQAEGDEAPRKNVTLEDISRIVSGKKND